VKSGANLGIEKAERNNNKHYDSKWYPEARVMDFFVKEMFHMLN
jgi:hypothetical protein